MPTEWVSLLCLSLLGVFLFSSLFVGISRETAWIKGKGADKRCRQVSALSAPSVPPALTGAFLVVRGLAVLLGLLDGPGLLRPPSGRSSGMQLGSQSSGERQCVNAKSPHALFVAAHCGHTMYIPRNFCR
jgi:hypothetical protein